MPWSFCFHEVESSVNALSVKGLMSSFNSPFDVVQGPSFFLDQQIKIHFSFFPDPPEIEIEQSWYQPSGEKYVEVELLCTVHSNPESEVKIGLKFKN